MISNAITRDKRINDLSDDTSRLAFTWLITFADAEGRTYGDPAVLRSMLFPRRSDISVEQMESYVIEWAIAGIIEWYEAAGDLWIHFVSFDKHQPGLRKEREAKSEIPEPESGATPELLLSYSGFSPDKIPLKLKEVKLNKVKLSEVNNNGAAAAAQPQPLTEGQRFVMDAFGAKRFRTIIQRDAVAEAETIYGIDKLREYTKWAATKGFTLGDAVSKMDLTLKKWGSPKPSSPVRGESEIDRLYRLEQEAQGG